jgi:ABC-type sugar transport system substrate-binding protein
VILSSAASENLSVWVQQLKAIFQPLGWNLHVCNGNGNVTTMENCLETFVTQKADAVVTMALGGPEIVKGLQEAKAAGIPVIAEGTTPLDQYAKDFTTYFADDAIKMGVGIADYYKSHYYPDYKFVGEQITQNAGGQLVVTGAMQGLKKYGLKYADVPDTDLANLVPSMQQNAQGILQRNSGKLFFLDFSDFGPSLFYPLINQAGRNKEVIEVTRYSDPTTVKLMRQGANILVGDTEQWQHMFDMTTAMLEHWTQNKPWPAPSVSNPGFGVFSLKNYANGANRVYPFDPAFKKQLAIWGKTWKLQASTMSAP